MEFCKCFLRQNGIKQRPVDWGRGPWDDNIYITSRHIFQHRRMQRLLNLPPAPSSIPIAIKSLCFLPLCDIAWRMSVLFNTVRFSQNTSKDQSLGIGRTFYTINCGMAMLFPMSCQACVGSWLMSRVEVDMAFCLLEEQLVRWITGIFNGTVIKQFLCLFQLMVETGTQILDT